MHRPLLSACVLAIATLSLPAANISFSAGGGSDTVLFESESGNELVGGSLHMGTFSTAPSASITFSELLATFDVFDAYDTLSGTAGNFTQGNFTGVLGATFPGTKLYLVVVNTPLLADATEFAVFASTAPSWSFPPNEITPASITLVNTIDQVFAGVLDDITNPGGIPGTFTSIQLETATTPEVPDTPDVQAVVVTNQPGIEFNYPTADAASVTFILQESDTLEPGSFTDTAATPVVLSDDGTTQLIRLLHPDPVSSQPKRFLRLKVTSD